MCYPWLGSANVLLWLGHINPADFAIAVAVSLEALVMICRKRSPMRALRDNSAIVTMATRRCHSTLVSVVDHSYWFNFCDCDCQTPLWWHWTESLQPSNGRLRCTFDFLPGSNDQLECTNTVDSRPCEFRRYLSLIFTGFDYDGLSLQQVRAGVDGVTMATPLDAFKTGIHTGATPSEVLSQPIFGGFGWHRLAVGEHSLPDWRLSDDQNASFSGTFQPASSRA